MILSILIYIQDWKSVFSFILILTITQLYNDGEIKNIYLSFGFASIVALILHIQFTNIESFENEKNKKNNEDDVINNDEAGLEDLEDLDLDDDLEIEETEETEETEDTKKDFTNSKKNNPIDMTETIKTALSNFDPKTLENMTNDTTKLIKSQSELMSVIEQMQPVISKGMALVDKFSGSGKTEELFKKFHNMSKNR